MTFLRSRQPQAATTTPWAVTSDTNDVLSQSGSQSSPLSSGSGGRGDNSNGAVGVVDGMATTAAAATAASTTRYQMNGGDHPEHNVDELSNVIDNDSLKQHDEIKRDDYNAKHMRQPLKSKMRGVYYQWSSLRPRSKIGVTATVVFFLLMFLLVLWDASFYRIGNDLAIATSTTTTTTLGVGTKHQQEPQKQQRYVVSSETGFAVVINTYKRPERLRLAVQHYADKCGRQYGVSQVFIVWAEQGVVPPSSDSFFDDGHLRSSRNQDSDTNINRSQVYVLQKSKDSLNSRFEPIDQLETTSVFMVDDDIRVSCRSLRHAFDAWKANPRSMVGYYPRLASPPLIRSSRFWWNNRQQEKDHDDIPTDDSGSDTELVYHAWPIVYWRHQFNFVLTKASFLHSRYLALYTKEENDGGLPREIKDHVDKHKNCEDIAMSMLVANYTTSESGSSSSSSTPSTIAPPIYVEGDVTDKGLFGGISTGTGHMATRSECLTELTKIFQAKGWKSPLLGSVPLRTYSWIHHSPDFWFQYRPSNIFEWFAFANTFT